MYQNTYGPSPTEIQQPFSGNQLQVGYPVSVPRLQVPQYLEPHYEHLVSILQLEIESNAQYNAVRTYMFNLLADNRYNNQAFTEVVATTVDFVDMIATNSNNMQIPEIIDVMIPDLVRLMVGNLLIQEIDYLSPYIDQQMVNDAQGAARMFSDTIAEIRDFQRRQGQYGHSHRGNPYGGWNDRGNSGFRGNGFINHGNRAQQHHRGGDYRRDGTLGRGGWDRGYPGQVQQAASGPGLGRTFGNRNSRIQAQEERERQNNRPVQRMPNLAPNSNSGRPISPGRNFNNTQPREEQSVEVAEVTPEVVKPKELVWKPSSEQRLRYAYNQVTHYEELKLSEAGNVIQVIHERTPNVDLKDHQSINPATIRSWNKTPAQENEIRARQNTFIDALNQSRAEREVSGDEGIPGDPEHIEAVVEAEQVATGRSLEEAWVKISEDIPEADKPKFIRFQAEIVSEFPSREPIQHLIDMLADETTYGGLKDRLVEMKEEHPKFYYWIDRRMTEHINRILASALSLSLKIDSFTDDWSDLVPLIERRGGPRAISMLYSNQERLLAGALNHMSTTDAMAYRTENGLKPGNSVIMVSRRMVTVADATLADFALDLKVDESRLVDDGSTLAQLVDDFLQDNEFGDFDRHMILLSDQTVLELNVGFMNTNSVIVTLRNEA